MNVTQAEIDEATMIAKNAAYKLAYELSLEAKYGGKIDCCMTKLKLLWMWANTLSCQTAIQDSVAEIEVTQISVGDTVNVLFGGETITGGAVTIESSNITDVMTGFCVIVNAIDGYSATLNADKRSGVVEITGPCSNPVLEIISTGDPAITYSGFSGGYCAAQSCLTDAKIKSLISKVRAMCTA